MGLTSFSLTADTQFVEVELTWTNPASIMYGTALSSNQLNATANAQGLLQYNPTYGIVLDAGSNTLSVLFSPTDTINYSTAAGTVSLVVLPAPLAVTASNVSRAFGMANPVFTGTISGVTNGDDITAEYSCSATRNSPPGTYGITPTLVDPDNRSVNYTITTNDGTLIVIGPPQILTTMQSGNSFTFTWSAISNQTYQIQSTTNLGQTNWTILAGAITATNSIATISEPISTTNSGQLYRVVVLP